MKKADKNLVLDPAILQRISEEDIFEWLAAKAWKMRRDGLNPKVERLELHLRCSVVDGKETFHLSWNGRSKTGTSMTQKTLRNLLKDLRLREVEGRRFMDALNFSFSRAVQTAAKRVVC